MDLQISPSSHVIEIDGFSVRLWYGISDQGVPCRVFVHRIAVPPDSIRLNSTKSCFRRRRLPSCYQTVWTSKWTS